MAELDFMGWHREECKRARSEGFETGKRVTMAEYRERLEKAIAAAEAAERDAKATACIALALAAIATVLLFV